MVEEIENQIQINLKSKINSKKSFTMGKHNRNKKLSFNNLKGN
jgi:tRNA(Ser,Leu) C12 N-acetylase TAN1